METLVGEVKVCKTCGETKSVSEFYANRGGRWLQSWCKVCHRTHMKQYTLDHPEAKRAYNRRASLYLSARYHMEKGHKCSVCGTAATHGSSKRGYYCDEHRVERGATL